MNTPSTRVRNKRGEGGRLREQIIKAGAELLDETNDQQAVTLRAVARRVGIAAPSIYAHFPDRDSILLAVVQGAFADLHAKLQAAQAQAGSEPVARLFAVAHAYLDYARTRPQRYQVMFGGIWNAEQVLDTSAVTASDAVALGEDVLRLLVDAVTDCMAAGRSSSTDPAADAVALWVGLHGLAHQRAVSLFFPWPAGIAERLIERLALVPARSPG